MTSRILCFMEYARLVKRNSGGNMKRIICILLCALTAALSFCGCSGGENKENKKLSVVTTIFPIYDWVKNIAADSDIDIYMLQDEGVDFHSYQPTADDMIKISSCDLFIYVGGESDKWIDDALKNASNPNMKVLDLFDALGDNKLKTEKLVEGMEAEDKGDLDSDEAEDEAEYDEHIWLSVKIAEDVCQKIRDSLSSLDEANKAIYSENCDKYTSSLAELDEKYKNTISKAKNNTLVFGDRFPFRYLADDYRLNYYAAFAGCSSETEASFETVAFLADKLDELGLDAVLTIEGSDQKLAKTIIEASNTKDAEIITVNSMQSVTKAELDNGYNYISVMEKNLSAFENALS